MDLLARVLFVQHPYTLLVIGALLAVSFAGLVVLAIRIYQYLTWRADEPHRELLVIASGLSSIGRQGRLPLPSPTVGSRLVGSTPRVGSPPPPLGDPRPTSPPAPSTDAVPLLDRLEGYAFVFFFFALFAACVPVLLLAEIWTAS